MNFQTFKSALDVYPFFSVNEAQKRLGHFDSRRLVEWQEKGYLHKIRNKYYYFSGKKIDEKFLWRTANQIYKPSYISLETALGYYNLIPEFVYQITSVSTQKTNAFETPLGHFNYRRFKPALYFGYKLLPYDTFSIRVAEIEKSVLDYIYLHPKLENVDDWEALRFNTEMFLEQADLNKFQAYLALFKSKALTKRADIFLNQLYSSV